VDVRVMDNFKRLFARGCGAGSVAGCLGLERDSPSVDFRVVANA
jgi:hypothetical protein